MTAMLEACALTKNFGLIEAVRGVSFSLEKGEVLGFMGPNGAGKTTTMKMLTGFLEPTSGAATVMGHDVASEPILAKRSLGYLPEGAPAYGEMTPREFLSFVAAARGLDRASHDQITQRAGAAVNLLPVWSQPIETLSKGFRRRVGLAQAIMHDPDVLILDEPTDGLDPNQKFEVRRLIGEMSDEKAIIISTHILEEVEAVCTRAIIIDRGRVVADGTPGELKARSRYHNAVTVVTESDGPGKVLKALDRVDWTSGTALRSEGSRHWVTAFSVGGAPILDAVRDLAVAGNWSVEEISVHEGQLDDVFRTVTRSETDTGQQTQGETGLEGAP